MKKTIISIAKKKFDDLKESGLTLSFLSFRLAKYCHTKQLDSHHFLFVIDRGVGTNRVKCFLSLSTNLSFKELNFLEENR